jgi:hypothetical protein
VRPFDPANLLDSALLRLRRGDCWRLGPLGAPLMRETPPGGGRGPAGGGPWSAMQVSLVEKRAAAAEATTAEG